MSSDKFHNVSVISGVCCANTGTAIGSKITETSSHLIVLLRDIWIYNWYKNTPVLDDNALVSWSSFLVLVNVYATTVQQMFILVNSFVPCFIGPNKSRQTVGVITLLTYLLISNRRNKWMTIYFCGPDHRAFLEMPWRCSKYNRNVIF